jgi:hypothetical protein
MDCLGYILSWLCWLKAGFLVSKGWLLLFSALTGLRALHSNQYLSRQRFDWGFDEFFRCEGIEVRQSGPEAAEIEHDF